MDVLYSCTDCAMTIANAEPHPREGDFRRKSDGLIMAVVTVDPSDPDLDDPEFARHAITFSTLTCDTCDSHLAGRREAVAVVGRFPGDQ